MDIVLQKTAADIGARGRLDPVDFLKRVDFQTFTPPADLAFLLSIFGYFT